MRQSLCFALKKINYHRDSHANTVISNVVAKNLWFRPVRTEMNSDPEGRAGSIFIFHRFDTSFPRTAHRKAKILKRKAN